MQPVHDHGSLAVDFDQLRYFERVAERQNFTRAAEDLAISQPALSRSIQRLEEELGQPVFERGARAISLTEAGALLLSRTRQVLAILEETKAEIADDGQSGRVRVGAIPTIARTSFRTSCVGFPPSSPARPSSSARARPTNC